MIRLLQPQGLVALATLLLPVAIHLMRRADRTVLEFAALRFLDERPHPRREWRVRERVSLALRLLLLITASLLLAVPVWLGTQNTRAYWLAVAPGVDEHVIDGAHPLAASTTQATLASQIRELDAQLPLDTQLDVTVPEELGGLDAERLRLAHAVRWQVAPGKSPAAANAAESPTATPLAVALHTNEAGAADLPVARALLSAWNAAGAQAPLDTARWLLWLGGPLSAEATEWVKRGGRVLATRDPSLLGVAVLSDDRGTVMFRERRLGHGRVLSTTLPLTLTDMPGLRDAAMAERLQSLMAAPLTAPDRAHASDVRPLKASRTTDTASTGQVLTEYAAALAALLYLAERVWATR